MPLLYKRPETSAEMFVLTYADHAANEFFELAAFHFVTPAEAEAAWALIPFVEEHTQFLVDRHTNDGMTDNRFVEPEFFEKVTRTPIARLISEARIATARYQEEETVWRLANLQAGKHTSTPADPMGTGEDDQHG